ncbi:DUF881 domain-containing protein [Streptomyces sp. NPDC048338]|uniref:DUF881 domain-containing protein n=1 Tax=Streptomyces sp. NPDC048338 TaxID=3365536 RepID=UPI0037190183
MPSGTGGPVGNARPGVPTGPATPPGHGAPGVSGAPANHGGPARPGVPGAPTNHGAPGGPTGPGAPRPVGPVGRPLPPAQSAAEAPAASGDPVQDAPEGSEPALTGRQRLAAGLWPPRVSRAQLIVAVLLFVLGLGLAIQVRSTSDNSALRGARQEDLVRILDELDDRTQRLEDEKTRLESQRSELESSSDQAEEARKQTQEKESQLGILAGTVAAEGPGITLTIDDGSGAVESDMLLDAIQELRAAGAEAIQVNDVRVVADSYFSGGDGDIQIDGTKVTAPYVFKVIGKPEDLEPALNIPGGVVQTLEKEQATATVARSEKIIVDALRPAKRPDYAQSSSQ